MMRVAIAAVSLACALPGLSACGSAPAPRSSARATSSPSWSSTTISLDRDLAPAKKVLSLQHVVQSIARDPRTGLVWLTAQNVPPNTADPREHMVSYDPSTGRLHSYALPTRDFSGQMHTLVAPDGSVWVNEDYELFRLTPSTGQVRVLRLALAVPGELPSATTGGMQGTWISGFSFDAHSDVLVSRENVPAVQMYSSDLSYLKSFALPATEAGSIGLVLTKGGLLGNGTFEHQGPLRRLHVTGALPPAPVQPDGTLQGFHGLSDNVFADSPGRVFAVFVSKGPASHSVVWSDAHGRRFTAVLPKIPYRGGDMIVPPPGGGTTPSPSASPAVRYGSPYVQALLPTPDGTLWMVVEARVNYGLYELVAPKAG